MSPAPALVVRGPAVARADEILTPEALEFVADLQREFGARRDELARTAARAPRGDRPHPPAGLPPRDPGGEGGVVAGGAGPARPHRPAGRDHRPDRAEDGDQRPELGRPGVARRPRGRQHPALGQRRRRAGDATRRRPAHPVLHVPRGQAVPVAGKRPARGHRRAAARLAPRRAAPAARRPPRRRGARGFRAARLPQRGRAAAPRQRPVRLPAQDREPPRGAALERRLHLRRGPAPDPVRQRPRDRAHRDDSRRVRDGGDPPRAARPRERAQCRALGLPLQSDQELPGRGGRLRAARPERRHDDRAADAGVHRAARVHLPPAGCVRDRRDGRLHPEPPRRGGERAGAGEGPRRQGTRGRRRLRRLVGGAPGPGAGVPRGVRPRPRRPARTSSTAGATTSGSRPSQLLDVRAIEGRATEAGAAQQRRRRVRATWRHGFAATAPSASTT